MKKPSRRLFLALTVAGLSVASLAASLGCGGGALQNLKARAEYDLRCPRDSLQTHDVGGAWAVEGCGRSATYVLAGAPPYRKWVRNSDIGGGAEPTPVTTPQTVSSPAEGDHEKPLYSSRNLENQVVWNARLEPSGADFALTFFGVPAREPDAVTMRLIRNGYPHLFGECELKVVADGQLLELSATQYEATAKREQLSVKFPLAALEGMARAQRVLGQICSTRFQLGTSDLALLNDFLVRLREELALAGTSGGTAAPAPEATAQPAP